jgi:radical SAM-linked protein
MQSESPEPAPAPAGPSPRAKYRIRFAKTGDLRLVSHHDLLHCVERMFRRAGLPVPATQGFNPRPRVWFAQSLALGVAGRREVLELELTEPLPDDELHRRLAAQCPPGLAILSVRAIDPKTSARVRRAHFRLPLAEPIPDLPQRCADLLAQEHHWIERTRPHRRRLDLRPFIGALRPSDDGLAMALWVSPYGAARPEEVVEALGLRDVLEAGAVLERTDLELVDEATDAEPPPAGLPTRPTPEERSDRTDDRASAPRPTAIITGPLSFDA